MNRTIDFVDWGMIPYAEAYRKQQELFESVIRKKTKGCTTSNTIIFCEHPHVLTFGKNASESNLLFPKDLLKEKGVELFHVDRGGDITYHGPGQIVGYPIIDLENFGIGLKEYIYRIEKAIILLLDSYSIKAGRLDSAAGVWIDADNKKKTRKICAIGVRSSRFITMHGFALNICTDLDYFQLINPCGFVDKGVTSLEKELGGSVDVDKLKVILQNSLQEVFPNAK
jgi:lipoate-protein ligase B